jgi:autotransporter-associated beta strand protein
MRHPMPWRLKSTTLLLVTLGAMGGARLSGQTIPDNDSFSTRVELFGTNVVATGNNAGATFEAGEPDPSFQGGKSVWWTWTAPSDVYVTLTTTGSTFDTMLTVFTGTVVTNLALVVFNDTETNTSVVTFNASAGVAYQIAVDGAFGATGSVSLQLTVGPVQTPPANDNFANRITLSGSHLSNVPGSNLGATKEPGEPFHADAIGEKSVWWTWTAPSSGGLTLTTQGSSIDTLAAIYTGNSVANLVFVAANDEDPLSLFGLESRVTCNVTAGTTYQIAVDGFEGDAGDIRLRLDLESTFPVPANDNFANRITLTGSNIATNWTNVGASFEPDEPLHLLTLGGKSVWWKWTAPASGGVTLTVSNNVLDTLVAVYKGTALTNLVFVAGNDEDVLTPVELDSTTYFNVTSGTTYLIAVDAVDGASGTFRLSLVLGAADPVPANDNFANRINVTGTNTTVMGSNLGATLEIGEPLHRGYYGGKSVWWRWTAPDAGFVTIDTIGSQIDTLLAIYTGTSLATLIEVASDDESGGNYTSLVRFPAKSNVTYQIAVDGYDGDGFDLTLRVRFTPASYSLTLATNPVAGGAVNFSPLPDQGGDYAPGSVVTLTATPAPGTVFTGWTGSVSSTNNPLALMMNSNKTVTGMFFILPTTRVWTGGSVPSANWTTGQNWSGGAPNPGDSLIFPNGAERLASNTNDFPANTIFKSITFGGADYVLSGNAVSLTNGIVSTNASGTNWCNLNVQFNASQTFACNETAAHLVVGGNLALGNRTLIASTVGGLTLSGVISGTGGIVKTNAGTLSLTGNSANSYTGPTVVNQGLLELGKTGVAVPGPLTIGDGNGGVNVDVVRFNGNAQLANSSAVTINSSGQLDLAGFSGVIGSLTMTSGNVETGSGSLGLNGGVTVNAASATATIAGNLSLQGAARTFNVSDGSAATDLMISAAIADGTGTGEIIKSGAGTLQITASNTYSGMTTVNGGSLAVLNSSGLGTSNQGTIINSNGTVSLNGLALIGEPLTLAGGTLASDSGSNFWSGNITLNNSSLLVSATNAPLNLSGAISGAGSITKTGVGTLIFSGNSNNTYSGLTSVNQGTLLLGKSTSNAVPSALVIGDGTGGANADVVRFAGTSQLGVSSSVTVNSSGRLDLDGFSGALGSLAMTSGNVDTGAGILGLNGDLTVNSASAPANITGNLSLQGGTRTFSVANGAAAADLVVAAVIGNGTGSGAITKTGGGTAQFTAANTYSGITAINEGKLAIFNASALGSSSEGTILNSNAVLSVNSIGVSSESLTLAGGTLASDAGSNFWTGNVALTNDSIATVATNSTLNLSGALSGTGGLAKGGVGTLLFSGASANTYSGATTVNQGTLLLNKIAGLSAIAGVLVIGDGTGGMNGDVVRLEAAQQISTNSEVIVNSSGLLDLKNSSDAIGALSGDGHVAFVSASAVLNVGNNNASTSFNGIISGPGGVEKVGTGTLTLTGDNSYTGLTSVSAGRLIINGLQPGSAVIVNAPGLLGGSGHVGGITSEGTVSPGASPGILTSSQMTFLTNATYRVELNGPAPGSGYDQLNTSGNIVLAGALDATLGFAPGTNETFTIISNEGAQPVVGTFNGLPEGSVLLASGVQFRISYAAGSDSNDVVLRQLSQVTAPTINTIAVAGNGVIQLEGSGEAGQTYILEATPALEPLLWTPVSTNTAGSSGLFQFVDPDAPFVAMRFYRVLLQ